VATTDTLRRFRVLLLVSIPLHTALAIWFGQYLAPADRPNMQTWADSLAWLQVGVAIALLACGLVAHALLRNPEGTHTEGLALQATFCTVYLAFGAAASILDVGIGNGIATFMMICMGMAVLSLMRPVFSGLLFGLAFLVFWSILRHTTLEATLLASLQIQAISAVLMAQLIAVMMWHQYTRRVLLGRALERTNAALLAQQQALEALAERDTLTGLYNRRKFMQLAAQELERAARVSSDICLLMVDLDFFKRINDQHGHPAGDAVLKHVAEVLREGVRCTDVVARMGGEEFIVLMPHTRREGALAVAEKLRNALRERPLDLYGRLIPMTASFGLTRLAADQSTTIDTLYAAADQALYTAKHQGRDRVEYAEPATTTALTGVSHMRR
jgi:diguanylate cyclase (GGDEF)-like protein